MPTDILVTGRLVGGHPMEVQTKKDDRNNVITRPGPTPGTTIPVTYYFFAVAIPKTSGVPWQNEPWGQAIEKEAKDCWNLGEWQHPTFAWKITDGDSTIPKKPYGGKPGRIPNQCEGYPGHWVIGCSTEIPVKCYHLGKYDPMQQIQNKDEIKCGDYCRVFISVKGNKPAQSPGVYINPTLFELSRAGQRIVTGDGPDAATAFGASAPVLPLNGQYDNSVAPPAAPGVPPPAAPGVPPPAAEPKYLVKGVEYTLSQLKAAGWSDAQIAVATPVGAPAPAPVAAAPVAPAPVAPAPSAPAMDFLQPPPAPVAPPVPAEDSFVLEGKIYTRSQLLSFPGWTEAHLARLPRSTGVDVPF